LRVGIIFYGSRFSGRELGREGLVLRNLPYHASGYSKPRSERSKGDHLDRESKPMFRKLQAVLY
jgi:hypothetical protein